MNIYEMLIEKWDNLLFEDKATNNAFIAKFGRDTFDAFKELKSRIAKIIGDDGNPTSLDLSWHTKNTDVNTMNKIIDRARNREYEVGRSIKKDIEGKTIPEPSNTKKLVVDSDGEKMYLITDVSDMIDVSEGTGDGSVGGRKTGWCIGGRYNIPFGQVKVSQANRFFNSYKSQYKLDNDGFYVVITPETKFCVMVSDNEIINVTDIDDNDHYRDTTYYEGVFASKAPKSAGFLGLKDWSNETFVYDGTKAPGGIITATISENIDSIGDEAFEGCINLKSIVIPDTVKVIGNRAFRGCKSLENVTMSHAIVNIGDRAFQNCTSLTTLLLPDSITSIGNNVFQNCLGLEYLTIPDSVKQMGIKILDGCSKLHNVSLSENCSIIPTGSFSGCSSLEHVDLPDTLKEIGDEAFYNCTNYQMIIRLPIGIEKIGRNAFKGCGNIKQISIPDTVTTIGDRAIPGRVLIKCLKDTAAYDYCLKNNNRFKVMSQNESLELA